MIIGSEMSDGVRFSVVFETAENLLSGNFWWNSPCQSINNSLNPEIDYSKVIKLFNDDEWIGLGLAWRETAKK